MILVPEAEPVVGRWRDELDPSAADGMPAHITINHPFVTLTASLEHELAELFGAVPGFPITFAGPARFPETLYLAPEPAEPLSRLIAAVATLVPEAPPYGGIHDEVIPHLTVAHGPPDVLDTVERDVMTRLPISASAHEVAAMSTDPAGRWDVIRRFPLST